MPKSVDDRDNPEWTASELARARRGIEHLPGPVRRAIEHTRRGRGPQKAPTKHQVTLRLNPEVVAAYRSEGRGWQSRINRDLATLVANRVGRSHEEGIVGPRVQVRAGRLLQGGSTHENATTVMQRKTIRHTAKRAAKKR